MIKTLNDFVLIIPDKPEEKQLESGIYLPEVTREVPQTGTLFELWDIPAKFTLQAGTRVWYRMWAGQDLKYGNQTLKSVHKKDILAYEDSK